MIIKPWEQALLETIQSDAKSISSVGIFIDTDGDSVGETPYCTEIAPVKNFDDLIRKPGLENKINAGIKTAAAPLIRQVGPFSFHNDVASFSGGKTVSPSPAASTQIIAISASVANEFQVARTALITANFSCFANAINQRLDYWIEINKVVQSVYRFFFNDTGKHLSVGGNWIVTLPPGSLAIELRAQVGSGASTISLDSNDCCSLSVIG